jgi:hypothetical protein
LGRTEIEILQALARNEHPVVPSSQRLRLEMLGLVIDAARGLSLTPAGRSAAEIAVPTEHERVDRPERELDAAGRRRMGQRVIP